MDVVVRSFRIQKVGNGFEECEDKSYPTYLNCKQGVRKISGKVPLTFGLADGATEGMFSGVWAEILVKSFCRAKDMHPDMSLVLAKASASWNSWMRNYLAERERRKKPIQWFEEPGLKAGGFSTLLGLVLTDGEDSNGGKWWALAVGDTCVFQVREKGLITSFPMESSSSFSSTPSLVCSNAARNARILEANKTCQAEWHAGDRFYLMTDAIACWFLREYEEGNQPFLSFPYADGALGEDFELWADSLRSAKQMRNDDVTLIDIEIV